MRALAVESDAYTTLLGAHGGEPGVIVALGTGSIAAVLDAGGACRIAGGYGFPSGDEASGAWLGLRAVVHLQQVLDGRAPADAWSDALLARTGGDGSRQSRRLAVRRPIRRLTRRSRRASSSIAGIRSPRRCSAEAGREIGKMVAALDPAGALPVALCGGLAAPFEPFVPAALRGRLARAARGFGGRRAATGAARAASGARFAPASRLK